MVYDVPMERETYADWFYGPEKKGLVKHIVHIRAGETTCGLPAHWVAPLMTKYNMLYAHAYCPNCFPKEE